MCIRDRGVDTVIHGDIADTVPWEKVLNQMPGLQIVTPQSAEVLRDDKVDSVSYTHLGQKVFGAVVYSS